MNLKWVREREEYYVGERERETMCPEKANRCFHETEKEVQES